VISPNTITISNDPDKAISLMRDVSVWMKRNGKIYSKWWEPENMNKRFMLKKAEPGEFYFVTVNDKPAAAVILQDNERNQSWKYVDRDNPQPALYVHWLAVIRHFAGQGLPKTIIDFAANTARKNNFKLLRLDTDANEPKLMSIYKNLGFQLMAIDPEGQHKTAYFQMEL
jgi:ribosomal protein S18 acetylase RimI-like enzyme